MADTFKGIITADGKKRQLPYGSVLDKPVSDETLSIEGGFADAKVVGGKFEKAKAETASLKEDIVISNEALKLKKNLVDNDILLNYIRSNNNGKVSAPWANEGYNSAYADVEGVDYVTVNGDWCGSAFAFFADKNDNVIGTKAKDYQISETQYVFRVPENAKRLYFSANVSAYSKIYNKRGFVVLSGTFNINEDAYTVDTFKLGGTSGIVYADLLSMRDEENLGKYLAKMEKRIAEKIIPIYKFYCEKDGSGDFSSITEAVNFVNNNNIMDATIYVGDGTWDLISELGNEYVENVGPSKRGLYLKNRVHLICSSKCLITCKYQGTNEKTIEWLSAFNMGKYGASIENAHIESDNVRYTIHDEYGYEGSEFYKNQYINCYFKHTNGKYVNCIGGGLGINGEIEIRGCFFEGNNLTIENSRLVYYHGNNEKGVTSAKCFLEIHDNYFSGMGTFGVIVYGDSEEITKVLISNNSVGTAITKNNGSYAPKDNIELVAWNNEVRN